MVACWSSLTRARSLKHFQLFLFSRRDEKEITLTAIK